jgi:asparagine synthase (glutamine-hydrolysing)
MCGIIGIVARRGPVSREIDSDDLQRLRHRGPDGHGICNDADISFGHTRLAIIDPSPAGRQPMWSPCGRFVITFNGEIYNHEELRHELRARGQLFNTRTDTEVLLSAYKHFGVNCLTHLRGMFSFVIWDRYERRLFAARDRCGERPFFYWFDEEQFIFASELNSLIPRLPASPTLNPAVVDMYLHFQYVPEPWTLLTDVQKLPAAHCIQLDLKSWQIDCQRYWRLDSAPDAKGLIGPQISAALEDAVRVQLRSDVPVGIALSGGIDSGAIAAFASKHAGEGLHAFTVGYPDRPANDEREHARALGEQLGMVVHEVEIPVNDFLGGFPAMVANLDEPLADPAAFAHQMVPKAAAAEGIKVLLGGIGGDEVFWGYEWTRRSLLINRLRSSASPLRRWLGGPGVTALSGAFSVLTNRRLPLAIRTLADAAVIAMRSQTPVDQPVFMDISRDFVEATYLVSRLGLPQLLNTEQSPPRYWPTSRSSNNPTTDQLKIVNLIFETWMVSNCLTLGDRVAMASSVEMRQPFLDHRLIELVIGLQRNCRGWSTGHKSWLRKAMRGTLPADLLSRPKRGFTPPVHDWLRAAVGKYGKQCEDGTLVGNGLMKQDAVINLIRSASRSAWPNLFTAYKVTLLEEWARHIASIRVGSRRAA